MHRPKFCAWLCPVVASLSFCELHAQEAVVDFAREVLPVLSNKCFVCHGPDAAEAGEDMLRLDSFEGASIDRGGSKAIDPATPAKSTLLTRIHSADDPMPPADSEKQLTNQERNLLTRWVEQGGRYTKHWAYVVPKKTLPDMQGVQPTPGEPDAAVIDAYIGRKLTQHNIDFSPEADRATLARRISLILVGLPPEPHQLQAFLADESAKALKSLLSSLMESPRYGEHQARYWLDAVRYGDTHGLHLDNKRGIYPYRDWVVRAFNRNMPLNQFIIEQLAGDLLPNPTLSNKVATGFVRMNPSTAEGGAIPAEFQMKNNFDRTETLGTVLLGASLTCARCHTHKYDPIQQTEYYALLAFFNNTAESPMDGNKYEYGPVLKAPGDQLAWQRWDEIELERKSLLADARRFVNDNSVSAKSAAAWGQLDEASQLSLIAKRNGLFSSADSLQEAAEGLIAKIKKAEEQFTTTLVAQELPTARTTQVLQRGEYNLPIGDPLTPNVPSVLGAMSPEMPRNRLGLAYWLTGKEQPLVARVLVNRIWQQVFGYGLVRTPEDFGLQGEQPTHPELLDWLAVQLQESGWDLQHTLRLMIHSRTFRQASSWRTDVDDPENRLFARASSYRLDAEVLRDLGLWSSNLLDPHMGGEGVKPYQPSGMWKALAHPGSNTKNYEQDKGALLYRRSLYVYWKRTSPHPMMTLFDAPDRESSCVRRSRTNTSLQSLGLLNETQRIEMSRALAARLLTEHNSDEERLNRLFTMLATRAPSPAEQTACLRLLASMKERYTNSKDDATALLATGEYKAGLSLDPAQVAAWSQVATTVLASDAAIMLY